MVVTPPFRRAVTGTLREWALYKYDVLKKKIVITKTIPTEEKSSVWYIKL